jgi:hypothetical protein
MTRRLKLRRVGLDDVDWARLDAYPDRTVCQTRAWLEFVAATQQAQPVVAELQANGRGAGWFSGLLVRKFGVPILGSPFPGWTTAYMGFNLDDPADWSAALAALPEFAFGALGCASLELLDRQARLEGLDLARWRYSVLGGFEVDLTLDEAEIFGGMGSACRRAIRKAEKSGVSVEVASDGGFVDDYYPQLQDVFAKQGLVPTYPPGRVAALVERLLPTGRLLLLRAREPGGRCIATGIFPGHGRLAYFWGGASWRADQHLRPNELVQWAAMRWWHARGASAYDMGGGGEYKRKYGGKVIAVPWLRLQRYPWLENLRAGARQAVGLVQRLRGRGLRQGAPAGEPD